MMCLYNFFNFNSKKRLNIDDFKEMKYVYSIGIRHKEFNNRKPGGILLEYFDKDVRIGYIKYYITTGQIGLFFINKEYQNRGLGKQILSKVISELKENNCKEVWAVTLQDHPFWSNVYNKSFQYKDPVHSSVTGDGYFMKL